MSRSIVVVPGVARGDGAAVERAAEVLRRQPGVDGVETFGERLHVALDPAAERAYSFVDYDEVAHHSGLAAPDALDTLRRTDDQLERLVATFDRAPRPYYVVVLADHGQTQGATFKQRYGETLDAVVQRLAKGTVAATVLAEEGWNNVNGLLTDAAADESRIRSTIFSPYSVGQVLTRKSIERLRDSTILMRPSCGTRRSAMFMRAMTLRRAVSRAEMLIGGDATSCSMPSWR